MQEKIESTEQNAQAQIAAIAKRAGWQSEIGKTLAPSNVSEAGEMVRSAEASGAALLPVGGGTKLHIGCPPAPGNERALFAVSLRALNRVTDYAPDDLTVTCEPGITLDALQSALAEQRLMLALDSPLPQQATLGGIVSANAAGFWRGAFGTPRDLLIGCRAVMTGGAEVKGGGKVVKNVAGYDVCKLFTGAWGTLGILTELTFKLRPLFASARFIAWDAPDLAAAAKAGLALHHARLAPLFLLVTSEMSGTPRLIAGMQGIASRMTWQSEEFSRRVRDAGLAAPSVEISEAEVNALRDRQARTETEWRLAARIACLPADLPRLLSALEPHSFALTADCAAGTVSLAADVSDFALVKTVRAALIPPCNVLWTRLEGEAAAAGIGVWGEPGEDFPLQQALKRSLDPKETFSPGRFAGRL